MIGHNSHATNGYGVLIGTTANVYDNLILPSDGRGVILGDDKTNCKILRNVILFCNKPNAEYGKRLNACAIRSRYTTSNNLVADNIGLGLAGGEYCAASGLYLSTASDATPSSFQRNRITKILKGPPSDVEYAQPIPLERTSGIDTIQDNIGESNCYFIRTSGLAAR